MKHNVPVLIAGAGPVGLCTAIELARRGNRVMVVEARERDVPPSAKCNTVAARTMEVFRRFGIAEEVRAAGLPDSFPTDIVFCTAIDGFELTRIPMPSREERALAGYADSHWRTPEPQVRISQLFLEPILSALAERTPGISFLYGTTVERYEQDADGVTVTCCRPDGQPEAYRAAYLIGADGGRSVVRKAIGAKLTGVAELVRTRTTLIRAPGLLRLWGERRPAWMSWVANHNVRGNVVAIDGKEVWLVHRALPHESKDFDDLDLHQSIRDVLGVGPEFSFEVLNHEDWVGRRMVADRLRDRRVFIAGDAAHLWVPFAGYGMNAGIADGMNLAWLLSNVLEGWADPRMLEAYQAERHPITEQVSRFAMKSMLDMSDAMGRSGVPRALSSRLNPAGAALRRALGAKLYQLNVPQFAPEGLNFGYYYANSPIVQYDDRVAPAYSMGKIVASTVPGCRLPHIWLADGRSLYDELGPGYTLLRFDESVSVEPFAQAARQAGMRIKVSDLPPMEDPAYSHKLLIVRQDQHIAWRGDVLPAEPHGLVDLLCGRAGVVEGKSVAATSVFGKSRLGYVVVESNKTTEWRRFGRDGLGLHVDELPGGALGFRVDAHERRILVRPGPAEDVVALAFELDGDDTLFAIRQRLNERGVAMRQGTPEQAALRGVQEFFTFTGPKQLQVELYTRPVLSDAPLRMKNSGFLTGAGGLGHVAILTRQPDAFQAFWEEVFDARLSDCIEDKLGGTVMDFSFLRVNERHHTVAVASTRGRRVDPLRTSIHHLNLQAASLDDVSAAYLRCRQMGYPIANAIGQHPNDRELSFYVVTPSGFEMELGWNPIVVEEASWEQPPTYRGISLWGHFKENQSLRGTLTQMRQAIASLKHTEHIVGTAGEQKEAEK